MRKIKILAVSDEEILKRMKIEEIKEKFRDVDFILSAGDLSNEYLDFLFSVLNKDLIYVNGNHTYQKNHDISFCKCIDGAVLQYKGIKFLGFDGSFRYSGAEHQYTEKQMRKMFFRLIPQILLKKPDIVLTHTPPKGIHDKEDIPHRGFEIFNTIIKFCKPKLWVHGHIHLKNHMEKQESIVGETKIINAFGYKIIEAEI